MGSSSMTDLGVLSLHHHLMRPLNHSTIGQKIYFVDVCPFVSPKSADELSSYSGATPPKKGRGGVVQSGEPPWGY